MGEIINASEDSKLTKMMPKTKKYISFAAYWVCRLYSLNAGAPEINNLAPFLGASIRFPQQTIILASATIFKTLYS